MLRRHNRIFLHEVTGKDRGRPTGKTPIRPAACIATVVMGESEKECRALSTDSVLEGYSVVSKGVHMTGSERRPLKKENCEQRMPKDRERETKRLCAESTITKRSSTHSLCHYTYSEHFESPRLGSMSGRALTEKGEVVRRIALIRRQRQVGWSFLLHSTSENLWTTGTCYSMRRQLLEYCLLFLVALIEGSLKLSYICKCK